MKFSFITRYKWHILFWSCYFIFWTFYAAYSYHVSHLNAFLNTFGWFIGQASMVYACSYWLIPRFINRRRYFIFAILLAVGIALSTAFEVGWMAWMGALINRPFSFPFSVSLFLNSIMGNSFTIAGITAIKFISDKVRDEKQKSLLEKKNLLLEKEKTENELRFLRSQINPHFLFNAINSIYVLIKKEPDFAAHTLVKFADMLRYQLYECNADSIPIEKEIIYLENYIELEKLRKGPTVRVQSYIGENARNFSIAPLLIIPFVENAFKFVSSYPDKPGFIKVGLDFRDDLFELRVENDIDEYAPDPKGRSWGGIGLENVKRRLALIYNGHHSLDIRNDDNIYSVQLKIQIK